MDMSSFLVDAYFTEHESQARYMMGSSDPESLSLEEAAPDLSHYSNETLSYALGNGYLPLREKLARLYETVHADQIIVMNGGEETIYVTMRALLRPGDELLVQMPSYQSLTVIAKEIGCHINEYHPSFEHGWRFDPDELQSKLTPRTRALILNYPHNPTGACLTYREMETIVRICKEHDLCLISDEAYRFLRIDETCTDASFADLYAKSVVLESFSKTFASPGLRLGWIAAKDPDIRKKLLAYRHFTSTCTNLPCQWIADELLNKKDLIIKRNNAIVKKNAALLKPFIERHKDLFSYVPPKGATMAYVRLRNGISASAFCQKILDETGILIIPSSVLEDSDEYLRIGLCRENFPECLQVLEKYLMDHQI